jgi:homoserine dehydrogenase
MIAETCTPDVARALATIGATRSSSLPRAFDHHVLMPSAASRTINVALLGCGVIGREIARYLLEQRHAIAARTGFDLRLQRILVRDRSRDRGIDPALLTDDFDDCMSNDVDIVIEALGGLEPASEYVERILSRGVSVITANKTLIANCGLKLQRLAVRHGAHLAYEASVCAAVPILAAIERLRGDHVRSITAIVNGTCNFILTRMAEDGIVLEQALREARSIGLAEPDPSADLSGRDSAEKLSILAAACGAGMVRPSEISVHGIDCISPADILAAKRLGCVIRLVAALQFDGGGIRAQVCPALLPLHHPLAAVKHENNAILITSEWGGDLFLHGKGAGPRPTVAAIMGDLIDIASNRSGESRFTLMADQVVPSVDLRQRYLLRFTPNPHCNNPCDILDAAHNTGLTIREIECGIDGARLLTDEATIRQIENTMDRVAARDRSHFIAADMRRAAADVCATRRGKQVVIQ